jgi:hypothetical protein
MHPEWSAIRIWTSDGALGAFGASSRAAESVSAGVNPAVPNWTPPTILPYTVRMLRALDVAVYQTGGPQHITMENGVRALLAFARAMFEDRRVIGGP